MAVDGEQNRRSPRLVVCGGNSLAYHLVVQLVTQAGGQVTVILPPREQDYGPRIAAISKSAINIIDAAVLDEELLRKVGVDQASVVALVGERDARNIEAALKIHALNKTVRLVIRLSDMNLGEGIRAVLPGATVLSDVETVARSFVAEVALRNPESMYLPLSNRTHTQHVLYTTKRGEVAAKSLICELADKNKSEPEKLLPRYRADDDLAKDHLVLALGSAAAHRRGRDPLRVVRWFIDELLSRWLVMVTVLLVIFFLVVGTALFSIYDRNDLFDALYNAFFDVIGAGQPEPDLSPQSKIFQTIVTLVGISVIIPLITAAVVTEAVRPQYPALARPRPIHDHVVLVGLGTVGTRVLEKLHNLGVPVVCVDRDKNAHGVPLARRERVPIVFGDVSKEKTLREAYVGRCRALVVVTDNDVINLAVALQGSTMNKDKNLRVVPRLFDDDLAEQVQHSGITITGSVSCLIAPAFATAMLKREIVHTIPVDNEVLLIAEVPIKAGSALDGEAIHEVDRVHEAQVIAIRRHGKDNLELLRASNVRLATGDRLSPSDRLATGDQLTIVATDEGLGRVLINSNTTSWIST